jgi:hypothetical protein
LELARRKYPHARRTAPLLNRRQEDTVLIKRRLKTLLLCLPLLMGAFAGMPMRPEEIEELMRSCNQQKITMTIRDESEDGDEPYRNLSPLDLLTRDD